MIKLTVLSHTHTMCLAFCNKVAVISPFKFQAIPGQHANVIIIITYLCSAFRSEDTEALDTAQED